MRFSTLKRSGEIKLTTCFLLRQQAFKSSGRVSIGPVALPLGHSPIGDSTMKTGLTLTQMAAKVEAQIAEKRDYVVTSSAVEMTDFGDLLVDTDDEVLHLEVTETMHHQLAQATGIHGQYYRKMRETAPELIAVNVNHWLQKQGDRSHVLRTMGNQARAFLGGGYEIVDHDQVLMALIPELDKFNGDLEILSTEVTDRKLYIKLAFPKLEGEIRKGDIIRSGVTICNSEIGEGGLNVYPANFRLICTNGMTRMEQGERLTVRHSGSKNRDTGEILTRERANVKVEQFIENFTIARDEAAFQRTLTQMRNITERPIEVSAEELMVRARKHFGLTLDEQKQALEHLLIDEDLTAYGLMNAVTRTAQDVKSYDRATELESLGSKVLALPQSTWREIALTR
jgi:Domain of unknown function (DUF932)